MARQDARRHRSSLTRWIAESLCDDVDAIVGASVERGTYYEQRQAPATRKASSNSAGTEIRKSEIPYDSILCVSASWTGTKQCSRSVGTQNV